MALHYIEFDTTASALVKDLRDAILTCTDWSKISSTTAVLATTSAASAANATTLTFTTGVPAATFTVGQVIRIGAEGAADTEYRTITAIAATTVTVGALSFAHALGTSIYNGLETLKATTTRGADMIVDLTASGGAFTFNFITATSYTAHTGTAGTNPSPAYVYYRSGATVAAAPVHVVLSVSKEHLYFSVEGPRAGETGAQSTTVGSYRNSFFICDLVPYHAGDTVPVVFVGGNKVNNLTASVANLSYLGHLTKNQDGTAPMDPAKLATLTLPSMESAVTVDYQRNTAGDGKYYLFPYVVISDTDGVRGRLSSFFFAGMTQQYTDAFGFPPIGSKLTYNGQLYKVLAVTRSPNDNPAWNQFGAAPAANTKSIAVAIPCT